MVLAISTGQPFSEVCGWDDRAVDTAWALVDDYVQENAAPRGRGDSGPGAGGPQYSG
jgi:hypothetical protein